MIKIIHIHSFLNTSRKGAKTQSSQRKKIIRKEEIESTKKTNSYFLVSAFILCVLCASAPLREKFEIMANGAKAA